MKTGDRSQLLQYDRDFRREILGELTVIQRVAPVFYRCPWLIRWCFTAYGIRAGRTYLDIAAGRKTYNAVFQELGRSMIRRLLLS